MPEVTQMPKPNDEKALRDDKHNTTLPAAIARLNNIGQINDYQHLVSDLIHLLSMFDKSSIEYQAIQEKINEVKLQFNIIITSINNNVSTLNELLEGNLYHVRKLNNLLQFYIENASEENNDFAPEKNAIKEKIEKIETLVKSIIAELAKIAKFQEVITTKENNESLNDAIYNVLLVLARICPRNYIDPISQETIPTEQAVYTSDRYQFDIVNLADWIKSKNKFINPFTNKEFNARDIETIKEAAKLYGIQLELHKEYKESQQPDQLSLQAMLAVLDENERDLQRFARLSNPMMLNPPNRSVSNRRNRRPLGLGINSLLANNEDFHQADSALGGDIVLNNAPRGHRRYLPANTILSGLRNGLFNGNQQPSRGERDEEVVVAGSAPPPLNI